MSLIVIKKKCNTITPIEYDNSKLNNGKNQIDLKLGTMTVAPATEPSIQWLIGQLGGRSLIYHASQTSETYLLLRG